jgi:hypothetical protein
MFQTTNQALLLRGSLVGLLKSPMISFYSYLRQTQLVKYYIMHIPMTPHVWQKAVQYSKQKDLLQEF